MADIAFEQQCAVGFDDIVGGFVGLHGVFVGLQSGEQLSQAAFQRSDLGAFVGADDFINSVDGRGG